SDWPEVNMFGSLGVPELLFIFALALLVFGPKKLPQVGRALGRGMAELRKATTDIQRTINAEMIAEEMREADPRRNVRDTLREVKDNLEKSAGVSGTDADTDPRPEGETSPPEPQGAVARDGSARPSSSDGDGPGSGS
ncbi:MAG: twin-arginine translocase TatA/TatE family subunit, partial [Holophagales bacterium]|nr:twin-arginine translocase TatA/TatE family subunit [Holophagales bacterium]